MPAYLDWLVSHFGCVPVVRRFNEGVLVLSIVYTIAWTKEFYVLWIKSDKKDGSP